MLLHDTGESHSLSSTATIQPVTFREFAAIARRRSWTVQSLAARFRGRIDNPTEFFSNVIDGKAPDKIIPYRSVLEFYAAGLVNAVRADHLTCACDCGREVFDRKLYALPGCKKKAERKRVRDGEKCEPQPVNFVDASRRQNRPTATLPSTERCDALRGD